MKTPEKTPDFLPLLPVRNTVVYPGLSVYLIVGRDKSVKALNTAQAVTGGMIIVVTQREDLDDPETDQFYQVGTLCKIENVVGSENEGYQILVTGMARYKLHEFEDKDGHWTARGDEMPDLEGEDQPQIQALFATLKSLAKDILDLMPGAGEPLSELINRMNDPAYLSNLCSGHLDIPIQQKQELLEDVSLIHRMESLLQLMEQYRVN